MVIFRLLAAIVKIYSMLIIIRFILSWFGNTVQGKFIDILRSVTDPYLAWWARNLPLRIGIIDFSAVLGITALSILQDILSSIGGHEIITVGIILSVILTAVWNVIAFVISLYVIIIILRLIAYLANSNIFNPFWQIIDQISQPVIYRVNKFFFKNSANNFVAGIVIAIVVLIVSRIVLGILVSVIAAILRGLPI